MKRIMMTVAAIALTAGSAVAMDPDELRESVALQINQYAPEVAVETLTEDQVKQVYMVLNDSSGSPADKTNAIGEIIEGTNAEFYADLVDGSIDTSVEVATMRERLQAKLDIRGFEHDVATLSDDEVVELITRDVRQLFAERS